MSILTNIFGRKRLPDVPGGDGVLREAFEVTPAPGEDASYRRLMAVIAEDIRLRQPAPAHRPWAWAPAFSATAAVAVLLVLAYDLGVHRGQQAVYQALEKAPPVAVLPNVPIGSYVPPPSPVPSVQPPKTAPTVAPREPSQRPAGHAALLASLMAGGLAGDQKDLLLSASEAMEGRDWPAAAERLVALADASPQTETAAAALHAAGTVLREYGDDPDGARDLFLREAQVLDTLLQDETDSARVALLKGRLIAAQEAANAAPAPDPASTPGE